MDITTQVDVITNNQTATANSVFGNADASNVSLISSDDVAVHSPEYFPWPNEGAYDFMPGGLLPGDITTQVDVITSNQTATANSLFGDADASNVSLISSDDVAVG